MRGPRRCTRRGPRPSAEPPSAMTDDPPHPRPRSPSRCAASSSGSPASSPTTASTSTCGSASPRAARGERRGQEHAHERPRRALPARCRRGHRRSARGWTSSSPRDAIAAGLGMVHQHFALVPTLDRDGERPHRPATGRASGSTSPASTRSRRPRAAARAARRPARPHLAALRRRAAACRDPQVPLPRRTRPHPRRAHGGPRPAGGGRALPDAAVDGRRGRLGRVHQPQARRGLAHRRPGDRHAPRTGDRRRIPSAGATPRRSRASWSDASPRDDRADAVPARARSCSRSGTSRRIGDRGLPALRGVSLDIRAGEILGIAGVAGNGQSELAQVVTGLRPTTSGSITVNGTMWRTGPRARPSDSTSRTSPRTGRASARPPTCRSRTTSS